MKPEHRYEVIIYWSDEDEAFLAEVPELAGCMADGATYGEALEECAGDHSRVDRSRNLPRPPNPATPGPSPVRIAVPRLRCPNTPFQATESPAYSTRAAASAAGLSAPERQIVRPRASVPLLRLRVPEHPSVSKAWSQSRA